MFVCSYVPAVLVGLATEVDVAEYFSPIYWMVPQIVKALPPLSRRRDKPKSARRRCPGTNHFLYIITHMWHESLNSDSSYWCSYDWCKTFKFSSNNLISFVNVIGYKGCSLSVPTDVLFALMCIGRCAVRMLSGRFCASELCCSLLESFYSPLSVSRIFSIYKKVPKRLN